MQDLIQFRKELHAHPELSGQEEHTATRVNNFLQQFHPAKIISGIGGHGLVAIYEFSDDGPTVLIRCELDALPIFEKNDFPHGSNTPGISHKCGHDGHMVILCGLAKSLHENPLPKGKVILLFQPAEETGQGAKAMLEDPKFEAIKPDYVFALHNLPGLPLHQILWAKGQFTPTVQSLAIKLNGKSAHASEPENGINPTMAIAEIIQAFQQLEVTNTGDENFTLITPVHVNMGQKDYGISAGFGELHFTMRCRTATRMDFVVQECYTTLQKVCATHRLSHDTGWFDYFPSVQNDNYCNNILIKSAETEQLEMKQSANGCKFGEDFGFFTQQFPGVMFGLGAGLETPALHHDDYDFPDELITTGVRLFRRILTNLLID